ncbi:MAG: ABC-three component system middle component 2 [Phocaeicola sp.]
MDEFFEPKSLDMLYVADFMTAYGATFHLSNTDLNGENPYKYSEFASRREVVQSALKQMVRREVVQSALKQMVLDGYAVPVKLDSGIAYTISSDGEDYCQSLESEYAKEYRQVASRVIKSIGNKSERSVIAAINRMSADELKGGMDA